VHDERRRALTHVHINHVIKVDFNGFSKAVNALGCIYADVDRHYYSQSNRQDRRAGRLLP
jgi:anionic cell wall polymer biosynthesis LytR-Cps2A-Psr (LCP) family protein